MRTSIIGKWKIFYESGIYKVPEKVSKIRVFVVGGGGFGGSIKDEKTLSSGGGGGGSGFVEAQSFDVQGGQEYKISVYLFGFYTDEDMASNHNSSFGTLQQQDYKNIVLIAKGGSGTDREQGADGGSGGSAAPHKGYEKLNGGKNGSDGEGSDIKKGGRGQHNWQEKLALLKHNSFSAGEGGKSGDWDDSKGMYGGGGGGDGVLIVENLTLFIHNCYLIRFNIAYS